jgi:cytochrome b6-f complex iron-sulfur subunit
MAYQNKPGPALASVRISESRELEKVGGFVLVKDTPEGDLLIVRTGAEQYSALSNECPHKQCLVEVKSPVLIQCPCHKSAYRIDGTFVKGPAKTSLRKFPLQVEGDLIVVTKG